MKDRGDQDAQSLLDAMTQQAGEGPLKTAGLAALASIKSRLALWDIAQNLWYGLSASSVLLLAAIGLAITFGVMGVINMAHGEMVMLGAYSTFIMQSLLPPSLAAMVARFRDSAGVRRRGMHGHSHRAAGDPLSSMAGRWRRCSPPGAFR